MPKTERFIATVTALARIGAGLSFAVLIGAVLLQVIGRSLGNSPVWTEELTRFALLFLIAFGAGLSLRSGDMVNVDIVCEALPGRWPWRLRLLSALATGGMALYLLPHAWRFVSIGRMQSSPALGLKMSYVHVTVFLMLALLVLFAALRVLGMLTGTEDGTPEKAEDI
ncbi:TRAP transporter small permease [Rhodovulum sulfidophilum]|uniref:TRAP transporter small permease protein n=1 Tax=Rhodovulum sulfidophilum TaxID=35806 RepID=A0A0D6B0K3_RHOSU|nr:TRAP transporter small permease [Rhodovulum sulfidophilum]ANB35223.1 C4-dicarboxylate ABC transporter substrate-binding protein [Rhodovulum sulfidophilum DSM 1374]ANB39045.1 C4-dicarboxylate ABC transporter substrate-binding protein [Rhodovulum sulfidophilum]MBK5923170.1 TRAP transporter small permease [Rhodovulum sulfidophilum]MBL3553344.1 TRAP transporter small permease [Rhodovulum sulfidophilum]MBL3561538.1 TRAP transporter small permease [Rhodovulum sulfidophilum]